MRKAVPVILLLSGLLAASQALGTICALDNVPAATLLIPYFETTCDGAPDSTTTFFSVNNASATPALAHVTLWTDWSVPGVDFNVYLTGYDVQTIDVRAVFCSGELPRTGAGQTPTGAYSTFGTFPGCTVYPDVAISESFRQHLRAWFSGQASPVTEDCAGSGAQGDPDTFVGYVTIDNDAQCSVNFPAEVEYYLSDTGSLRNQLWGDYVYLDRQGNLSNAFASVHLEADASLTGALGGPTFYGRYNASISGYEYADGREPLPTAYGGRYAVDDTWFYVWREAGAGTMPVACGKKPDWWPLETVGVNALTAFDEAENPAGQTPGPSGEPPDDTVANETNRLRLGTDLPTPWTTGWYYLDLANSVASTASASAGQAYVTIVRRLDGPSGEGQFSGGWDAVALKRSCRVP